MKKIYLLTIAFLFGIGIIAQPYTVMVVSENIPGPDPDDFIVQAFLDNINAIEGITAEHVTLADYGTMDEGAFLAYDAAVLTENGTSDDYTALNDAGWPIPVVCLKAYMIKKGANKIIDEGTADSWWPQIKASVDVAKAGLLVVKDNDDILKDWELNDTVRWVTGYNQVIGIGEGEAHCQGFDLSLSPEAEVSSNATLLANNKQMEDDGDTPPNFLWKVEANGFTQKSVHWGLHHEFLETTTPAFWVIIENSLRWVLDMPMISGIEDKQIENFEFKVYPNPISDELHIDNALSVRNVEIIDITGKVIISLQDLNNPNLKINTSELVNGVYMIRAESNDGEIYISKIVK